MHRGRCWSRPPRQPEAAEFEAATVDRQVLAEAIGSAGAVIVGRRMFDVVEGWGYQNPFPVPCFVLTNRVDDELLRKAPSFSYLDGRSVLCPSGWRWRLATG